MSTVQRACDGLLTEESLRRNGHPPAAAERARVKRTARIRLDRLLGLPSWEPPEHEWVCPGEFGLDGRWQPHCRGDAA